MFRFKNAALLVDGIKDIYNAKTASSLSIYRNKDIQCYIQSKSIDPNKVLNTNKPVIKELNCTSVKKLNKKPDVLILCLMLPKGTLPKSWFNSIVYALENNINIINPFHFSIADFSEINNRFKVQFDSSNKQITTFKNSKSNVYNLRINKVTNKLFSFNILKHKPKRVLTVGTDCNVGKMLTTITLNNFAKKRKYKSEFVATGQIGILLKGRGLCVDRVISDFLPGEVENLILKQRENNDYLFIEGQGSLMQAIYAPVTLGLLHGSAPHALILCHSTSRKKFRYSDIKIPDLKEIISYYEETTKFVLKSKVLALSLNTHGLEIQEAKKQIKKYEDNLSIPVNDPYRFGVENIFNAIK